MVWMKVPYTNFHNLNQDWIIRRMQDFEDYMQNIVQISVIKYADPIQWRITGQYEQSTVVIDAESGIAYISVQPVPAGIAITNTDYWTPVFDLQQILGDIDQDLADETTAREAADTTLQENIDAEAAARSAADTALQENIDAETAARSAADTTLQEAIDDLEINVRPEIARVMPQILIGDILAAGQPAAVCVYGGNLYAVEANNYNGMGTVKKFNINGNNLTDSYYVLVGHANSVAYNSAEALFYLAPLYTYSAGTATNTNKIYRFSPDFGSRTELTAPEQIHSVSFDHVTNKMYAIGVPSVGTINVYEINNGVFSMVKTIDVSNIWNKGSLQDCAVNNGYLYINTPERVAAVFNIAEGLQVSLFTLDYNDNNNVWNLGEAEGWEFSDDGRLFMMNNHTVGVTATDSHSVSVSWAHGVITEAPVNGYIGAPGNVSVTNHSTLTVNADDMNMLINGNANMKSPMFYNLRASDISATITLTGTQTIPGLSVLKNIDIKIASGANITFTSEIFVASGIFGLSTASNSTMTMNTSNLILAQNRAVMLMLNLEGTHNGTAFTGNNAIRTGAYRTPVITSSLNGLPDNTIGINNKRVSAYSMSIAGYKVAMES